VINNKKIKVLIVDDSSYVRAILTNIFNSDERLQVVGSAVDPFDAREKIKQLHPDVLTLDIEMPKMDGITFLKNLMRLRPMPVVMVSTLTESGAPATLEALALGAFDFVSKPKDGARGLEQYSEDIIEKIVAAAHSRIRPLENSFDKPLKRVFLSPSNKVVRANYLVAIGSSTGGTEAIKDVLLGLPENCPPIVIAQHIPEGFSKSFAKRLDNLCGMRVYEAEDAQPIEAGAAYLAPGHSHLEVRKKFGGFECKLNQGELVNRHRPSVDVLFDSVISAVGQNALGALLTGMGADGAAALLRMRNAGCRTVIQDEASSVVWGMPGAAFNLGAAEKVLSLEKIAAYIIYQSYCAPENN